MKQLLYFLQVSEDFVWSLYLKWPRYNIPTVSHISTLYLFSTTWVVEMKGCVGPQYSFRMKSAYTSNECVRSEIISIENDYKQTSVPLIHHFVIIESLIRPYHHPTNDEEVNFARMANEWNLQRIHWFCPRSKKWNYQKCAVLNTELVQIIGNTRILLSNDIGLQKLEYNQFI